MDLKICRVCLRTDDLINIFENAEKTSKLQVQILSSTGSEIFEGDGMPAWMCTLCSHLIEIFHGYKQICKKAEMALKQYSFMTKKLPEPFHLPQEEKLLKIFLAPDRELVDTGTTTEAVKWCNKETQCNVQKEDPPKRKKREAAEPVKIEKPVEPPPIKEKKTVLHKSIKKEKKENVLNYTLKQSVEPSPTVLYTEPAMEITGEEALEFRIVESPKRRSKPTPGSAKPRLLNSKTLNPAMDNVEFKIRDSKENNEDEVVMEIVQSDEVSVVYACNYCERSFPLGRQLEIHEQDHFREREFACDICNGRFLSKHDLIKHLRIHTEPDQRFPWKCPICPRSFSRSNILKKHQEIHEDQMKFHCAQCGKKFLVETDLEKHVATEHDQQRKFSCQTCGKSFK